MEENLCGLAEISGYAGAEEGKITGGSAEKSKESSGQAEAAQIFTKKQKKIAGDGKRQKKISTKITTELQKTDETAGKTTDTGKKFPV